MKSFCKHLAHKVAALLLISLLLAQGANAGPIALHSVKTTDTPQGVAVGPGSVAGPSSTLFSYQGQLLDSSSNPITDPAVPMTFKLYPVSAGGLPCWTEERAGGNAVNVEKGLFHVLLGQITALNTACLTGDAYLELVVNGETLSPRELLTSVAFAVEAQTVPDGSITTQKIADGAVTQAKLNLSSLQISGASSNTAYLSLGKTSGSPSAFGDWVGLDFLHVNEVAPVPQFTGNPAARISAVLERGDNGYGLGFWTRYRDNTFREVVRITANGNVGIGTTSPDAYRQLHVEYYSTASSGGIKVKNTNAEDGNSPAEIAFDKTAVAAPQLAAVGVSGTARDFYVWVNGDDRLQIDETGKLWLNPGTASIRDTNLYRQSAGQLSTDASFSAGGNLFVGGDARVGAIEINGQGTIAAAVDNGGAGPHMVFTTDDAFTFQTDQGGRLRVSSNPSGVNFDGISWFYFNNFIVPTANKQFDLGGVDRSWRTAYLESASCGAILEANLQTAAEKNATKVDRFDEGDVLCWGIDQLELCAVSNDRLVQAVADKDGKPIVLGAEKVKVLGPVQRGDILVASDVPGYAMVNNDPRSGSVIAQALENFDGQRGIIKAMIRKW